MANNKCFDMKALLPHKNPMIFVDRVVKYSLEDRTATIEFDITEKSILYEKELEGVPVWAGVEYMAQSIGALGGIFDLEADSEPAIGFLLGARTYTVNIDKFEKGKTYSVEIIENFSDMELGNYKCVIKDEAGNICAQAEINTYKPTDPNEILNM